MGQWDATVRPWPTVLKKRQQEQDWIFLRLQLRRRCVCLCVFMVAAVWLVVNQNVKCWWLHVEKNTGLSLPFGHCCVEKHLMLDPLILRFENSVTCTVRQHQCGLCPETQIGKSRRCVISSFYAYYSTVPIPNPQPPTSFHNLLAEVEVCGGSHQLIRMYRLGCVSSPDGHDHFVTPHANMKHQRSVWDIPGNVFTIATVDNFDMLQSQQLFTQVISIAAIMVQQYNWSNRNLHW